MESQNNQHPAEKRNSFLPREQHFSIGDLSDLWGFSYDTIRREVIEEESRNAPVLKVGRRKPNKRRYTCRRIPESTAIRIYNRLTKGGGR